MRQKTAALKDRRQKRRRYVGPTSSLFFCLPVFCLLSQDAHAQGFRDPHIGYVFPAGAKTGATTEVLIGGQNLRDASKVVVSGPGMSARVLKVYKPVRNFDKEQREELDRRIAARRAVLAGKPEPKAAADTPKPPVNVAKAAASTPKPAADSTKPATDEKPLVMPEHVMLDRLPHADAAEIDHMIEIYLKSKRDRLQQNPQLGEMVTLEITVAPNAVPGPRELRLLTAGGLTNPLRFEVGTFTEVCEREPNDPKPGVTPAGQVAEVPVTFNGQVFPGDTDSLRFRGHRGQNLVIEVQARSLIPYLADAVPGWFQPVLAVFNAQGKEVAYADNYRFRPDPVVMVRVPDDAEYTLQIRDSIYRGREDFVYRIKVSEQPFVTACFPLGTAVGSAVPCRMVGWNLPRTEVVLDTRADGGPIREFTVAGRGIVSDPVSYAVDALPDAAEKEPNDTRDTAQEVPWPCVVNGRINKPGDVDVFKLAAPPGATVMVDVTARRLGSPLDSVVRVTDAVGKVLAWNDDSMPKDGHLQLGDGLETHHADSRVSLKLPEKGPFFVQIEDAQHQGGDAYGYRLRISPPQPDFALRMTPSGINISAGQVAPVAVHVDRRDGFNGPVTVKLESAPAGWTLTGNVIPPGRERVRMTLQAAPNAQAGCMPLHLTGTAELGGVQVTRPTEPCDDTMQAFLWRHLVPARECLAAVQSNKGRVPPATRIGDDKVTVPLGGEALVRYRISPWNAKRGLDLEAIDAPDGLTVVAEVVPPDIMVVHLTADKAKVKPGDADNLILGVTVRQETPAADPQKPVRPRAAANQPPIILPAVPLTIQKEISKP